MLNRIVYMYKKGFGIDNLKWLICHKTKPNQTINFFICRRLNIFENQTNSPLIIESYLEEKVQITRVGHKFCNILVT